MSKKLMTNEKYHASEGVGSSLLKAIAESTVVHALETPFEGNKSSDLGSGLHTCILNRERFDKEFLVKPKVDRRTKQGRADYEKFVKQAKGKILLDAEDMEAIKSMCSSIDSHTTASNMLRGGEAEFAYFAKCPDTGMTLKCRPDYINKGSLIDLKSSKDASPKGFARVAAQKKYHVQAAFYLDVYNLATGSELNEFYFVAVENSAPWGCAVYGVDPFDLEQGRSLYKSALKKLLKYKQAEQESDFKRDKFIYGDGIQTLVMPGWAYTA